MSVGTAIFDSALLAYPLYETSLHLITPPEARSETFSLRWLRFWLAYGGLSLTQQFGADSIPGFFLIKAVLLISMYSDFHSSLVNDFVLVRICRQYVNLADRAQRWWKTTAAPQVVQLDVKSGGWLSSIRSTVSSWTGFGSSITPSAPPEDKME